MTEVADDGRSRGKEQRPRKTGNGGIDPSVVGRRVFSLAYWALVVWVVVAAFVSVVRQVFWPTASEAVAASAAAPSPSSTDSEAPSTP